ncbi:diguanylate cyclase domain-containing protein [Chitinimonas naiadis]
MKLSRRLSLLVGSAALGVMVVAALALQALHEEMIKDRQHEIATVLSLARKEVDQYRQQELSGSLSRELAQNKALAGLSAIQNDKNYLWVRQKDGLTLLHPDADLLGKRDTSLHQPQGRPRMAAYAQALEKQQSGFFVDEVEKPDTDVPTRKINGVTLVKGWNWLVGYGMFVDDINRAYWHLALNFILIGLMVLLVVTVLAFTISRSIYRRLGGEPDYATEITRAIAAGDLSQQVQGVMDSDSLLGAVANLQQIIKGIHETAGSPDKSAAELDLKLRESLLRALTDAIPTKMAFVGLDQRLRHCNRACLEFFGLAAAAVEGKHLSVLMGEALYTASRAQIDKALQGETALFELPLPGRQAGSHAEIHLIPQCQTDGTIYGFHIIVWDVTQSRQREIRLKHAASIDGLTGLYNRSAMLEIMCRHIRLHAMSSQGLAVLYLDVDRFKQVNDTLGHAAGDALLVLFAQRLQQSVRASDYVARLGGDEFAILLTQVESRDVAITIAQKVLENVRQPVLLAGVARSISTSIGITFSADVHATADGLLAAADRALYQAKSKGRNTYQFTPFGQAIRWLAS